MDKHLKETTMTTEQDDLATAHVIADILNNENASLEITKVQDIYYVNITYLNDQDNKACAQSNSLFCALSDAYDDYYDRYV